MLRHLGIVLTIHSVGGYVSAKYGKGTSGSLNVPKACLSSAGTMKSDSNGAPVTINAVADFQMNNNKRHILI